MPPSTSFYLFCFFCINLVLLVIASIPKRIFGLPNKIFIFYLFLMGAYISVKFSESKYELPTIISNINFGLVYSLVPLFFLFTKSISLPEYEFSFKKEKWHFIPVVLVPITLFLLKIPTEKMLDLEIFSGFSVLAQKLAYFRCNLVKLNNAIKDKSIKNQRLLLFTRNFHFFSLFMATGCIGWGFVTGLDFKSYTPIYGIIILVFWIYNSLFSKISFEDISHYVKEISTDSSKKNKALNQKITSYNHIVDTIVEKQLYLQHDLTIKKLSDQINLSPTVISQVINQTEKKNFNHFINTFRIEKAKELLVSPEYFQSFSIESIAEKAGFKSKSSFYEAFKKFENCTPLQYRKTELKNLNSILTD